MTSYTTTHEHIIFQIKTMWSGNDSVVQGQKITNF